MIAAVASVAAAIGALVTVRVTIGYRRDERVRSVANSIVMSGPRVEQSDRQRITARQARDEQPPGLRPGSREISRSDVLKRLTKSG